MELLHAYLKKPHRATHRAQFSQPEPNTLELSHPTTRPFNAHRVAQLGAARTPCRELTVPRRDASSRRGAQLSRSPAAAYSRPCPPARPYLNGGGSWRPRGAAGGAPRAGGCGSFLFGRHCGNAERRLGAAAVGRRRGQAAAPSGSESSDSLRPKRRWKRPRRAMPSSALRRREERECARVPARRRPEPGRHRGQRCAGGGLSAGMDGVRRWLPPAAVYALLRRSPPAVPAHRRPPRSLPAEGAAPRQVLRRWHRKGAAGVRSVPRVRIRGHYLVVALRRPSGPSRALAPLAGKGSAVGARRPRSRSGARTHRHRTPPRGLRGTRGSPDPAALLCAPVPAALITELLIHLPGENLASAILPALRYAEK